MWLGHTENKVRGFLFREKQMTTNETTEWPSKNVTWLLTKQHWRMWGNHRKAFPFVFGSNIPACWARVFPLTAASSITSQEWQDVLVPRVLAVQWQAQPKAEPEYFPCVLAVASGGKNGRNLLIYTLDSWPKRQALVMLPHWPQTRGGWWASRLNLFSLKNDSHLPPYLVKSQQK